MEDFKFLTHKEETSGEIIETVDARELHNKLNVDTKFTMWISRRIEEYGFLEGEDFFPNLLKNTIVPKGRPVNDYQITHDMAKELCMLEHSKEGKKCRKYFIAVEKQAMMDYQDRLPAKSFPMLKPTLTDCIDIAHILGFTGNQAKLSAVSATTRITGIDPLELLGIQLVSDKKAITYTPTDLGKKFMDELSAQQVNIRLRDTGLQVKIADEWEPTDDGKKYCEVLDTGKRRTGGTPIKQVKWYKDVVECITDEKVFERQKSNNKD